MSKQKHSELHTKIKNLLSCASYSQKKPSHLIVDYWTYDQLTDRKEFTHSYSKPNMDGDKYLGLMVSVLLDTDKEEPIIIIK